MYSHNDAIGLPDRPQCSNFNVCNIEPNSALPKFIEFASDRGVHRVENVCNAELRFNILMQDCQPRLDIFSLCDMSISLVAS